MKGTKAKKEDFQKIITDNINNIIQINNKYKQRGYELYLKGNFLEIIYIGIKYQIKIVKHKDGFYWHLKPYKNSFFETKVDNSINTLDMVLFAINDNETIHRKENKK